MEQYSVVIPTFNRAIFLKRAIESVLTQTLLPSEIIVVDDGSSDNTQEVVESFDGIKYVYQKNAGVSSARNLGIKNAKYKYIAFLDSDDEWLPSKMQKQLSSPCNVSYTDEVWIREGKRVKIPKKFRKNSPTTFESEIEFCKIAPSSVVIHKQVFEDIGLFDESLEVCEDYDLWLRILLKYKIELVDEKLINKYAGHEDQLSFKHWGMDRFRVKSLESILQSSKVNSIILSTLVSKYERLIQGALKYDRVDDVNFYQNRVEYFKNLN